MTQDVSNEIISLHRRVLAYLEQQRATLGVYTPPYIQLEIEEKTRQIERLMHYSFIFRLRREVLAHERPAPTLVRSCSPAPKRSRLDKRNSSKPRLTRSGIISPSCATAG